MAISYLCPRCAAELGLTGFRAANEVGRKYCVGCGDNQDNLIVVDEYECDEKIQRWNKEHQ